MSSIVNASTVEKRLNTFPGLTFGFSFCICCSRYRSMLFPLLRIKKRDLYYRPSLRSHIGLTIPFLNLGMHHFVSCLFVYVHLHIHPPKGCCRCFICSSNCPSNLLALFFFCQSGLFFISLWLGFHNKAILIYFFLILSDSTKPRRNYCEYGKEFK